VIVYYLNRGPTQGTAMDFMFRMFWIPSWFVIPAITMRLLAEESRSGTLEMLMTAPVTDFEVVFAKWLGAVALYALMWGLTALYVLILWHFSGGTAALDLGPIVTGYIGVLVIGQFLISIGVLASSMTKSQVAAALMSFALIFLVLIVLNWLAFLFPGGTVNTIILAVSPSDHMEDFRRGILDLRPIVFYLSGTAWLLFVATRIVESRKWR
jgi:ABC-2 type transport system permease protein